MSQGLRPSQYITTFGPGAMVETPSGPHILLSTDDVLKRIFERQIPMDALEIRDFRLQSGLLEGDRIFKLPDSQSWERFFYPTRKFPTWNLCIQHAAFNVIHKADDGCPECTGKARIDSKKNKNAIRFLVACPNGHLDDVNWSYLVHSSTRREQPSGNCGARHFHWLGSGSSLSAITLRCPGCGREKPLGEIYSSRLSCRGRRPERVSANFEQCDTDQAIVVQRGSFQLRLPDVITSLTIPPLVSSLHRVLQRADIQRLVRDLRALNQLSEASFRKLVADRVPKEIPRPVGIRLEETEWVDIETALVELSATAKPATVSEYLSQEHRSLIRVVETGFPPYPHDNDRKPGELVGFQVDATEIRRNVPGPTKRLRFRVMPIQRLRVVMVQVGYRRVEYVGPNSVLSRNRGAVPGNPDETWIPGVEQFGEGIYVDLELQSERGASWYPTGRAVQQWESAIAKGLSPSGLIEWNALSVWWHSLSHRLLNAMSLHSGYSSTAIRERVYMSANDNRPQGGLLLYTTQPGGDGTMGGLTSLATDCEDILGRAFEGIDRCSNDPLCEHADIDPVSRLGAACYSCLMVSETSCEHYNGYLHRGLLLENRP